MKKSITKKVVFLYVPIIIGSLLISSIISNIAIKIYLQKEVLEDLKNEVAIVKNILSNELGDEKTIEREKFKEALQRSHRLDNVGLESQLEIIAKMPNNTFMSQSKKSNFDTEIINQIGSQLQGRKDKFVINSEEGNVKYYMASLPIKRSIDNNKKSKYWVILYTSDKEVSTITLNILKINILIMIIVGLIATIIAILFAKSITNPIIKLKNRAKRISKRDFESTENINTKDEIEELGNSLEDMAEELKNYDLSQKRFLQNASHELKTPLTSIGGYAEGLKDGVFDNTEEALDVIIDESLRLKKIVEQLIFLSKMETTHEFFKITKFNLCDLLEEAVKKVNGSALKKSVSIDLQMEDLIIIYADEEKLLQAIINILSNCIRHATAHININVTKEHKGCRVIINDDGKGFSTEDLAHLFERFYKGKNGSTGLGMSITESIISKVGGNIKVANNEYGGAQFIITLQIVE